ncbi:hypothetical protein [Arthrobacter sp. Rue61a]|uniref:hypothetical protein n=1 Tax=Arthrobacter sp. Rue61a TaxID=1118963 RepID=UPI00027DF1D2|nr:hypothetical protein [Arthrobacter sp. Rue61a]AFR30506.1 hypothetical protein ARUE_c36270 [Arthrobacter sp. Rue61a]
MSNPHSFSSGTEKALFRLSVGNCYFPGCLKPIIEEVAGKPIVGVQIAHIRGAEPTAPRYDVNMTDEERAAFPNLILLCQPHHTTIDRVSPQDYSVETLEEWKKQNEPQGGVEALRGLTESTLEGLIEDAVEKSGRTRDVRVDISCGLQTGGAAWTTLPFEILSQNETLLGLPKQLCVNISNVGSTDVSVEAIQILTEHEGIEGNPRFLPNVRFSEQYPRLPYRLLNGASEKWFVPFAALQIMQAAILDATGGLSTSGIFVLVQLATGEESESFSVPWSLIEPILPISNN